MTLDPEKLAALKAEARHRDPERISRMLDLLEEIWRLNPDLRLGQIIEWEARKVGLDMFYVEDDQMEQRLKARLEVERQVRGATA